MQEAVVVFDDWLEYWNKKVSIYSTAPSLEVVQVVHLHHSIFRNVNENLSNSKSFGSV